MLAGNLCFPPRSLPPISLFSRPVVQSCALAVHSCLSHLSYSSEQQEREGGQGREEDFPLSLIEQAGLLYRKKSYRELHQVLGMILRTILH